VNSEYSIMPVGLISGITAASTPAQDCFTRPTSFNRSCTSTSNDVLWSLLTMVQLVATTIFGQGVEWKFHAIFHSGSESSTSFSLWGAKVPGNESSIHGTSGSESIAPGSKSTWERKFQLPLRSIDTSLALIKLTRCQLLTPWWANAPCCVVCNTARN